MAALAAALPGRLHVDDPKDVAAADWSEAWKAGLSAIEISPRLMIRPSFVESATREGQAFLVIDPAQAFGTGGHESTRLALEWVAERVPRQRPREVLDVGTGTGVLALAALRLGAEAALGIDTDPLAGAAARDNARANHLAESFRVVTGDLSSLGARRFDLVLVNLLKREMLPILGSIAQRVRAGGELVFSGLLTSEAEDAAEAFRSASLRVTGERRRVDADGVSWSAWLTTP